MTDHLTVAEVLAIHADQIERYGGSHGVRDQGLLEAARYRPQTGCYADLIEEAAAPWETSPNFAAALYEANQFSFDNLVPWLHTHVKTSDTTAY